MNAIVHNFDFEGHGVRMHMIEQEPWFVLTDVCRVLDITNSRNAAARLDNDEKSSVHSMDGTSAGGNPNMTVINESGLYSLILTSRKPEAKRFKKWVTSVVLPAIRRDGFFVADPGHDFPVTIDGKVFGLPVAKVNAAARLVGVAKSIYGPEAARSLWESDKTLPKLSGHVHAYLTTLSDDDPAGALQHLLRSVAFKNNTVGQMLHLALTDRTMNQRMAQFGIIPGPVSSDAPIAFATEHAFLARVFADTPWCGDWKLAFAQLPGAQKSRDYMQFGAVKAKAILLPRADVLKHYLA